MIPSELQDVFGKQHAKVYEFTDSIPDGEIPQVFITVQFATAISNNLVDCIVTELQNKWYVYTVTPHEITGTKFSLAAELPLPEPEPEPESVEPPPAPEEETV